MAALFDTHNRVADKNGAGVAAWMRGGAARIVTVNAPAANALAGGSLR